MSSEKSQATAIRLALVGAVSELSKPDQAAVRASAQKIRDAIAECDAQELGLGLLALGLVSAEMQAQQA